MADVAVQCLCVRCC